MSGVQQGLFTISSVWNSYDLPADVFEPGEIRPTRPKKLVKKTESSVKKRSFETSQLEVSLAPHGF